MGCVGPQCLSNHRWEDFHKESWPVPHVQGFPVLEGISEQTQWCRSIAWCVRVPRVVWGSSCSELGGARDTCACVCALPTSPTLGGRVGFEATPSTWEQLLTPETISKSLSLLKERGRQGLIYCLKQHPCQMSMAWGFPQAAWAVLAALWKREGVGPLRKDAAASETWS